MTHKLLRLGSIAIVALAFWFPSVASAIDGVNTVNLNSPSVSGSSVTVTGSTQSGTVTNGCRTTSGGIMSGGPICNCCLPPTRQTDVNWKTCEITGAAYTITDNATAATVRNGAVSQTSNGYSPSGCTLECSDGTGSDNWCSQNMGFSLSESGLPAGSYTVTVTTQDCRGTKTASASFTIAPALSGSCSASPASGFAGQTLITLTASASGGTGSYSYSWSGTESLSGTTRQISKTYAAPGTKTADVRITSGSQSITRTCLINIQQPSIEVPDVTASCSASPNPVISGSPMTWTATSSGGNGSYTYSWIGNGNFPDGATTRQVTHTYTAASAFTANAQVTVSSGGKTGSASCSVPVNPPVVNPPDCRGTINVTSNLPTTWSISGPEAQNQTTDVTSRSYPNLLCGSYTISPAAKAGYSVSVTPSASQSLSTSGGSISFTINYTAGPVPTLTCTASRSSISPYETVSYTASGGASPYSWTSSGGNPSSYTGNPYSTYYTIAGTKTAYVTSGTQTAQCSTSVGSTGVASVDLDANNSDGPLTIPAGTAATLTWGGQYISSCTASGAWSGSKTPWTYAQMQPWNGQSTGALAAGTYTYTITCDGGAEGMASDSVTINAVAGNAAACVSISAPASVAAGQSFLATITTRNTGTNAWTSTDANPHRLGSANPYNNGTWGIGRLELPSTPINPGSNAVFTRSFVAPSTAGSYNFSWQMLEELIEWYGPICTQPITVTACSGNVNVTSNVATTWTLSGPNPQTQSTPVTSRAYTGLTGGAYTLTPATLAGYQPPVVTPAASQTLSCGGTLNYTVTYNALPPATVDLTANPTSVVAGGTTRLTWATSNIQDNSCTASASPANTGWSGSKADDSSTGENSGPINSQTTFTLTCRKASDGTNISDTAVVSIRQPQCNDGVDNIDVEDTLVDMNDPGCLNPQDDDEIHAVPECNDNVDNTDQEDTLIDENDPGCWTDPTNSTTYNATDNDERNASPEITECNDGLDNDGDGRIDTADTACPGPSERPEPDIREI